MTYHADLFLAYRHHSGGGSGGLGSLFGLLAALSVALRFVREWSFSPTYAVAALVLGVVGCLAMRRVFGGRRPRSRFR